MMAKRRRGGEMKTGAELIAEERERQVKEEGWKAAHDDTHENEELVLAALAYATCRLDLFLRGAAYWPWAREHWRPSWDQVRNLTKAGALIAAEIDRLQRKAVRSECQIEH
jgi:hypothetical protein